MRINSISIAPTPTIIPNRITERGPKIVKGLPRIHNADAKNESTNPWAKVTTMANQVQGKLEYSSGVVIPNKVSNPLPRPIPKMIGDKINIT